MEFANWINLVVALVILSLAGMIMLFEYLKTLHKQIQNHWLEILALLRKRDDIIPLFAEKAKSQLITQALELRAESMKLSHCDGQKIEKEILISEKMKEIQTELQKEGVLKKELLLAHALEMWQLVGKRIESETQNYNKKVRKYNGWLHSVWSLIYRRLSKNQQIHIFEFEV